MNDVVPEDFAFDLNRTGQAYWRELLQQRAVRGEAQAWAGAPTAFRTSRVQASRAPTPYSFSLYSRARWLIPRRRAAWVRLPPVASSAS